MIVIESRLCLNIMNILTKDWTFVKLQDDCFLFINGIQLSIKKICILTAQLK